MPPTTRSQRDKVPDFILPATSKGAKRKKQTTKEQKKIKVPKKSVQESDKVMEKKPVTKSLHDITNKTPRALHITLPAVPTPPTPSKTATEFLHKELNNILKGNSKTDGFSVELAEDNIFQWNVFLFNFDEKSQIYQDLLMYKGSTGKSTVKLEVTFPEDYPNRPPFFRVVYPRFHQYTGHITIGGSICVKDLTSSGWDSKNNLVSFIIMIRNLLLDGGALIDMDSLFEYTVEEARQAFDRVARQHKWIP